MGGEKLKPVELGRRAVERGLLEESDLRASLKSYVEWRHQEGGGSFGKFLIATGLLEIDQVRQLLIQGGEEGLESTLENRPDEGKDLSSASTRRGMTVVELSCDLADTVLEEGSRHFGRYLDPEEFASGGMGLIKRAYDPDLGRPVAIKMLRPGRGHRAETMTRFLREARIMGQLAHPSIPPVYELSRSEDGEIFFAMKLIEGRTLEEILEEIEGAGGHDEAIARRRELLEALIKISDALAFAHSRGVVHRDLKPANLMIGDFGEVLILDWGIAKILQAKEDLPETEQIDDPHSIPVGTLDGKVLGTVYYMSPEQAEGAVDRVNATTDVYGLGVILYEILTLKKPFTDDTLAGINRERRLGQVTPPSARVPVARVPRELDAVVLRAMARKQRDRYQSMEAFRADLTAYLTGGFLSAARYNPLQRGVKWIRNHRAMAATVGLVALLLLGFLGFYRWRQDQLRREGVEGALAEAEGAGKTVGDLLRRASALDRALLLAPGDARILERRKQVSLELGDEAIRCEDYTVAELAFRELTRFGVSQGEVDAHLARIDEGRTRALRQRGELLEEILADLRKGLSREDRGPGAPLLEDHVFEASRFVEPQTVEILGKALRPLIERARSGGKDVLWTEPEIGIAKFCCRVLGRMGEQVPEAVEPLADWLEVVWDTEILVEAGLALCNTRQAAARNPLFRLNNRLQLEPTAWSRIKRSMARIPEPSREGWPETAGDYNLSGFDRIMKGDLERALADFNRSIEIDPANAVAYANRSMLRVMMGDLEGALVDTERALALTPGNSRCHFERAEVLRSMGRFKEAIEAYTRAIEIDRKMARAYTYRALCLGKTGDFEKALDDMAMALEILPGNAHFLGMRGVLRFESGDSSGGLADLDRSIDIDPKDPIMFNNRGHAKVLRKDYQGAMSDFTRAIELDPRYVAAIVHRASCRDCLGDRKGALQDYDRVIEFDPDNLEAHNNRGNLKTGMGDLPGALEDFGRAIEISPDNASLYINRSRLLRALERHDEAIEDGNRALELDPDNPIALVHRGAARGMKGDLSGALTDFCRCSEVDPANWEAWFNMGQILGVRGKKQEALTALRKALENAPGSERALVRKTIERFEK